MGKARAVRIGAGHEDFSPGRAPVTGAPSAHQDLMINIASRTRTPHLTTISSDGTVERPRATVYCPTSVDPAFIPGLASQLSPGNPIYRAPKSGPFVRVSMPRRLAQRSSVA